MDEVDVRQRVSHLYSWRECGFNWRDLRTAKKLRDFGIAEHELAVRAELACAERREIHQAQVIAEVLGMAGVQGAGVQFVFIESVGVQETYWDNIAFQLRVLEGMFLTDSRSYEAVAWIKGRIATGDWLAGQMIFQPTEIIACGDIMTCLACWRRRWDEEAVVGECPMPSYIFQAADFIAARDGEVNSYGLIPHERVFFAELFTRKLKVLRLFEESAIFAERPRLSYGLYGREKSMFFDGFIRAPKSVLSDIVMNDGELTLEKFLAAIDTPPGYERFAEFNVGEYEYKKALVRLNIESQSIGSEPVVYDAVVNVDIDDTDDRGTALITDVGAATKVHFHKFYYHPPEVSVSLKGGNTADGLITPYLISVDKEDSSGRYFEVELLNGAGKRVAGQISWVSKGY